MKPCVALALLAAVAGGCATQSAMQQTRAGVGRSETRLARLERQLAAVDSSLQIHRAESRRQWAGLAADGEELTRQVQQVQARLDEISRRLAQIARDLEAVQIYGGGRGVSSSAASAPAPAPPTPALVADEQTLYELAMADMRATHYELAQAAFAQFAEHFPQSELADNALYWQGECHYARKEYAGAVAAFERVVKEYPEGDKVPAALLKLGYALPEVKEKKRAIQYLRALLSQYPDSEEASKARERLKALGASPGRG